jgi:hypothetical protein
LLAACVGDIGDRLPSSGVDVDGPDDDHVAGFEPAAPLLPRLTEAQYRNALADLIGPGVPVTPVEADTNPYLFYSIGATTTTLSELGTELYEKSADAVTHYVFADPARRAAFVGCAPAAPGDACVEEFLGSFGRRVLRRPLASDELARWVTVATELAQPDAWEGLRLAVAGLLQSPYFLYRIELGEPDPAQPGRRRLDGFEIASRLSFLLWDTTPDDELLDAAERGDLDEAEGVIAAAERLLADDRAPATIQAFFAQYLDLGRLAGVSRSPENYPLFTPTTLASMRTEVEMLVDDVVDSGGDARSIFSTRRTFVNAELAALYGVEAEGADATTFVAVELDPNGPRAGLLTLGAFLTMNAHETRTSPTARGKYVRERVLCATVPPPPPDVDTQIEPPGTEPMTLREQLEEHRKNPACAGCHSFIDPPGFLFEHFDSVGAIRDNDNGLPIDSSGDLDGVPLADASELAALLETDEQVGHCMVTQLYRHALGRVESKGEEPAIDDLDARFAASSYDFRALVVELVSHEAFRYLAEPEESQ